MKKLLALAMVGAASPSRPRRSPQNTQQERMKVCNTKAADKKGDERKAFMTSACRPSPRSPRSPRARWRCATRRPRDCKGEERNKAQSECMKAPG